MYKIFLCKYKLIREKPFFCESNVILSPEPWRSLASINLICLLNFFSSTLNHIKE